MQLLTEKKEIRSLAAIFSLFAIGIMAWIPRFPELKKNLDLSNGEFGTLVSTGSIGAITSLFLMGHIVHKFGAKKVLTANSLLLMAGYVSIIQTKSPLIFLICNIGIGFGISGFHIAVSAQAFHSIERIPGIAMTRFHGFWAVGALITGLFSGLVVNHLSLVTHIGTCAVVCFSLVIFLLHRMTPVLLKPNESPDTHLPIRSIFSSFRVDWVICSGLLCASVLEYCTTDWVAIYAKEEIGVSAGMASIPYITFMIAVIIGRLGAKKLEEKFSIVSIIRVLSISSGLGFILFLLLASWFSSIHQMTAFIFTCLAFTCAGAGSSLMSPTFYTAANNRSKLPSAVVVGHLGAVSNSLVFLSKAIVAWTAQLTGSLTTALLIPGVLMFSTAFFARATKND